MEVTINALVGPKGRESGGTVVLANETGQRIDYLVLNLVKEQILVAFDLEPNSSAKINIPRREERSWISCFGKLSNNKDFFAEKEFGRGASNTFNNPDTVNVKILPDGVSFN